MSMRSGIRIRDRGFTWIRDQGSRMKDYKSLYSVAAVLSLLAAVSASAQSKLPPTPAEWGEFEQLAVQPRGGLSPDGTWLVYGINRSNRNNELRIRNIATGSE